MPVLGTRRIRLYLVSSLSRMDAAELPNTGSESVRIFAKAAFLPFLLGIDFGMAASLLLESRAKGVEHQLCCSTTT